MSSANKAPVLHCPPGIVEQWQARQLLHQRGLVLEEQFEPGSAADANEQIDMIHRQPARHHRSPRVRHLREQASPPQLVGRHAMIAPRLTPHRQRGPQRAICLPDARRLPRGKRVGSSHGQPVALALHGEHVMLPVGVVARRRVEREQLPHQIMDKRNKVGGRGHTPIIAKGCDRVWASRAATPARHRAIR